jgi:ribonuclease P protein component
MAVPIQRLKNRSQFLYVRHGARVGRPTLQVEARRRAEDGPIGLGLTASKKVGNAVARNRARRRLREAARQLLGQHGLAGVDYVLVARQQTPDAPWAALLDDLGNALIRLRADLDDAGAQRSRSPTQRKPSKGAQSAKGD